MKNVTNDFWETVNWRNVTPKEIENAVRLGANINYRHGDDEKSLMHKVSEMERPDAFMLAKKMIELGANIHAVDDNGDTPLHCAIGERSRAIFTIETLLESGADVNAKNNDGVTPLHEAMSRDSCPATIQLLLEYGADVNAQCDDGVTPLHLACDTEWGLSLMYALCADACVLDVNLPTKGCQETPIFWAVYTNPNMVKFLIDRDADVNIIRSDGKTPLDYALCLCVENPESTKQKIDQRELDRTIQILRNAGGKTSDELQRI